MRLCSNCNEWFDDDQNVCPNCGMKYVGVGHNVIDNDFVENNTEDSKVDFQDDKENKNDEDKSSNSTRTSSKEDVSSVKKGASETAKKIKRTMENTLKKYNPWIVALVVIINAWVLLSIIDLFVSKYCWSCYPVLAMALGYCIARAVAEIKREKPVLSVLSRYMLILTPLFMFYAVVVTLASKVNQNLSYLIHYVLPVAYLAYIITHLAIYFKKGMGNGGEVMLIKAISPVSGMSFLIMLTGAVILKAEGFALLMCLLPFALSLLILINASLYVIINLKKKLSGLDKEDDEEVHIDYEIIDEDITGGEDNGNDKKDDDESGKEKDNKKGKD